MNLGVVGLGAMGSGIVSRLMAAGHVVTGWNRSKDKSDALVASGMRVAPTPRAVAAVSDIVFSIVTDAPAVKAVALGSDGIIAGLKPRGIYADMSTIAPDASRTISAEFAARSLVMLDAPISGSPVTLAQGSAALMVGGDRRAFERVESVLRAIGPKVTYVGGSGLAVQMKIAVNLLLMVEVIAFGEAVALAEKGGVAREIAVTRSSRASPPRRCWGGEDARRPARRCHAAAKGHAAGARARPQARQPGAAGGGRKRNDECLPRAGARSSRFRHCARRLPPPGGTDLMRRRNQPDTSLVDVHEP